MDGNKEKYYCVPEALSYIVSIAIGEELPLEQLAEKIENMDITLDKEQDNLNYPIIDSYKEYVKLLKRKCFLFLELIKKLKLKLVMINYF